MEVSSLQNIIKYVFFAVVLALLIYMIVYVNRVNYGSWQVQADGNVLRFTSPDGSAKFELNQAEKSIGIHKHKIKSSDNLGFYKEDGTFLSFMAPRELRVGDVAVKDQTADTDPDKKGVEFTDAKNDQVLTYITPYGIHLPTVKTIIKSTLQNNRPVFSVFDFTSNKAIVTASATAPLGVDHRFTDSSLYGQAAYSIM